MNDLPRFAPAVERAMRLAGPDATVQAIRALPGGTHARTWLIQTAAPELEFILREFPPGDDAAAAETRVLGALNGLDGLVPRILASGVADVPSEGSWTLISRLPGAADISPAQPAWLADQLGTALARIHATAVDGLTGFEHVSDRPGGSFAANGGPAASVVAAGWGFLTGAPEVLTHYDFWSGNVLWQGGVLTGVVVPCLIPCGGIYGPPPDLTNPLRRGFRTIVTLGVPI